MTRELEKRIYVKALLIGFAIFVIGAILGFYKFSIGIAIGTITSIFNFKLLAVRTNIISSSKKPPNPFFIIGSFSFRFLIMGAVLWIAIQRGLTLFAGASVGLFMVTIAIYINGMVNKKETYVPSSPNSN